MHFRFALLATTAAAFVSASPIERSLEERAGPSGQLVQPSGGTSYTSIGGDFALNVDYKPVNQNDAYTIGIDLYLEGLEDDRSLAGKNMTLANGFRGSNSVSRSSDDFKGTFSPVGACGAYRLIVTEHQYYQGNVIQFRSAAPSITIGCFPV